MPFRRINRPPFAAVYAVFGPCQIAGCVYRIEYNAGFIGRDLGRAKRRDDGRRVVDIDRLGDPFAR